MPYYIEKDETTAIASHVANKSGELRLIQVMSEMHRKRHIGAGERIAYGIGPHDRNAHIERFARVQVDTNHFDSKLSVDLISDQTAGAPYIEYAANGQRIFANCANHERRIPDQTVYPRKLPVRASRVIVRNIFAVEYFGFVLPLQE
jgi:hypothetical protein